MIRVYVTRDRLWRVVVRTASRVGVYRHGALMKDARSLQEAADYLAEQGVAPEDLVED